MAPVIDICGKELAEYVLECLARFNRGCRELVLRACGENISRAAKIAFVLSQHFPALIEELKITGLTVHGLELPSFMARLSFTSRQKAREPITTGDFVEFPIYHLALDLLLSKTGEIKIYTDWKGQRCCLLELEADENLGFVIRSWEKDVEVSDRLVSALHRSGYLLSPFCKDIAFELAQYDDVILGVDTNILLNAVLTEHLLVHLSLIDPKRLVSTPNWLLVVIPSAVMHELEQGANLREGPFLTDKGRKSYRGLQEILDMDRREDLAGVSLIIVGECNPVLDTRVELQRLREVLSREARLLKTMTGGAFSVHAKPSSGDMIIRDQFKHFLRQIDFHKGVYFLTADKSNAALARAEGLHSIYYKFPSRHAMKEGLGPPSIPCAGEAEPVHLPVPIGKLVYELAVEFGIIRVSSELGEIQIESDRKGELLDYWVFKDLHFPSGLKKLLPFYNREGKISLTQAHKLWQSLTEREE